MNDRPRTIYDDLDDVYQSAEAWGVGRDEPAESDDDTDEPEEQDEDG